MGVQSSGWAYFRLLTSIFPSSTVRTLSHHCASTSTTPQHIVWRYQSSAGPSVPTRPSAAWHQQVRMSTQQSGGPAKKQATAKELGMYWATGYGGAVKPGGQTVEEKLRQRLENPDEQVEKAAAAREVTVWFNGDVAENMPWHFKPTQQFVKLKPGQSTLAFFTARNNSDKAITGYSLYNVTPDKAAVYFNKIQCFCFEEQRLRAGEEVDMPVLFYIDPEFATDWNCRNIDDITLSYIFNKVDEDDMDEEDATAPSAIKLHGLGALPAGITSAQQQQGASTTVPAGSRSNMFTGNITGNISSSSRSTGASVSASTSTSGSSTSSDGRVLGPSGPASMPAPAATLH